MRIPVWVLLGVVLGILGVAASAGSVLGGAAGADPTSIHAVAPASVAPGAQTTLTATLVDTATNATIAGERLNFTERTTFGSLLLGGAITNARGLAQVAYSPAYAGNYSIIVSFAGDTNYSPTNTTFQFTVTGAGSTPPPALSPDTIVVLVVIAVVGGVWGTYALVAGLILGIRADRPAPEAAASPSAAGAAEVKDTMADEPSSESEERRERATRASKLAGRNAIIVAGLALIVGVVLGIGVGNAFHGSASPAASPPPEHLYLTVAFNPATGLDEVFPANITVPSGVPVIITITNYDNGTNPVAAADAQVSGTVGDSETIQVGGAAAQNVTTVDVSTISHTFTISDSAYNLNVPIPASADLAHPTIVTFTEVFGTTGTFIWRCMTPCDSIAMVTPGFMMGSVTVT